MYKVVGLVVAWIRGDGDEDPLVDVHFLDFYGGDVVRSTFSCRRSWRTGLFLVVMDLGFCGQS